MRTLSVLLLLVISSLSLAGEHYQAANCEFFIDQIGTSGSGGSEGKWFHVLLRVVPSRLDAPVKRVGTSSVGDAINQVSGDTYDVILYAEAPHQRSFFVETEKGTYYWINRQLQAGSDLVFDGRLFDSIRTQGSLSFHQGTPVRSVRPAEFGTESFGAYNLKACR